MWMERRKNENAFVEHDEDPRQRVVLLVQLSSARRLTTPFEKVGVDDSTMRILVRYLIHAPTLTWRWYRQRWPGSRATK